MYRFKYGNPNLASNQLLGNRRLQSRFNYLINGIDALYFVKQIGLITLRKLLSW